MYKLSLSKKVLNEIAEFQRCISQVQNFRRKKEFEILLDQFKNHIAIIDDSHSTEYSGYIRPSAVRDNIESVAIIRNKFYQLKKDLSKKT
jgi:hypothetical protein